MLKSINAYLYLRNEYGLSEDELDVAKDFKRQNYRWKMILSTDEIASIGDWIILRRNNQRDLAESMMRRNWGSLKKESTGMGMDINSLEFCKLMDEELNARKEDGVSNLEFEVLKTYIDRHDLLGTIVDKAARTRMVDLILNHRRVMNDTYEPTTDDTENEDVQEHLVVSPYASEIEMANLLNQRLSMRGAPHMTKFEKASIITKIKDAFFGDRINPDSIVIFICDGRMRIDNNVFVLTQPKTEG